MEIKVNQAVVASNRKPISMLGSFLGCMFYQAEARASFPDFDKKKLEVEHAGNIELITNRDVRRYRITGHEILSASIGTDAAGASNVYFNRGVEGSEVAVPVAPGMEQIGKVTDDALGRSLRGDKSVIFANPAKLAQSVNALNTAEKNRVLAMIADLQKCVQSIDSAIAENMKKVEEYERQLLASTPSTDPATAADGINIVVKTGQED